MRLIDTFGAVANLPNYRPDAAAQVAVGTGTDDRPITRERQDQIQDQMRFPYKQECALACSEADFSDIGSREDRKSRKSIPSGKTRSFASAASARKKAGISGLGTGLLGIEPRTF